MTGAGWSLTLVDGLIAKPFVAHSYESGMIARGWIDDAPVTVVVQTSTMDHGFNEWVRRLAAHWIEHNTRRIKVPGAADAARIDGYIEFDGLGAKDDRERCTLVCAKRGRQGFVATARSRPEDAVHDVLDSIIGSFELTD